jgi:hypothetical protein
MDTMVLPPSLPKGTKTNMPKTTAPVIYDDPDDKDAQLSTVAPSVGDEEEGELNPKRRRTLRTTTMKLLRVKKKFCLRNDQCHSASCSQCPPSDCSRPITLIFRLEVCFIVY